MTGTEWLGQVFERGLHVDGPAASEYSGQPGDRLLQLPFSVSDDVGTPYRALQRSAGGAGTEWRSEFRLEPPVPREATRLVVTLDGSDGQRHVHELELPDAR